MSVVTGYFSTLNTPQGVVYLVGYTASYPEDEELDLEEDIEAGDDSSAWEAFDTGKWRKIFGALALSCGREHWQRAVVLYCQYKKRGTMQFLL